MAYFDTKKGSLEEAIKAAVKNEKLDPVNKTAVKKKFDDRKDKDLDNDGDVDSSDKYLHKRRKAISKAVSKEEVELDESKMKELSMKIDDVVSRMKKNKLLKPFADKFKKDAMKSMNIRKSLEKVIPDYTAGAPETVIKALMTGGSLGAMEAFEYGTPEATKNSLNMTPGQSTQDWDKQVGIMQEKQVSMRETVAKMWGVEEGHNPFKKEEKASKKEGKTMTGKPMTKVSVGMKEK